MWGGMFFHNIIESYINPGDFLVRICCLIKQIGDKNANRTETMYELQKEDTAQSRGVGSSRL